MGTVIKFPKVARAPQASPVPQVARTPVSRPVLKPAPASIGSRILWCVHTIVWFIAFLLMPLMNWVFKIDIVFQLIRMLYYWKTPGVHAGWVFLMHLAAVSAYYCFVFLCSPDETK